jgi:hypothetical protein
MLPYFVRESVKQGTTHGTRHDSKEEAEADLALNFKANEDEFKAELEKMDDEHLKSQSEYWLKSSGISKASDNTMQDDKNTIHCRAAVGTAISAAE